MTGRARRQQRKRQRACDPGPTRRGTPAWAIKLFRNGWYYRGSGVWELSL